MYCYENSSKIYVLFRFFFSYIAIYMISCEKMSVHIYIHVYVNVQKDD